MIQPNYHLHRVATERHVANEQRRRAGVVANRLRVSVAELAVMIETPTWANIINSNEVSMYQSDEFQSKHQHLHRIEPPSVTFFTAIRTQVCAEIATYIDYNSRIMSNNHNIDSASAFLAQNKNLHTCNTGDPMGTSLSNDGIVLAVKPVKLH